jgi:hypothetical protein
MESLHWFILLCAVFAFIVYTYIASKVSGARREKKRRDRLPDAEGPLATGKTYNVQISNGRRLDGVTVVGMGQDWHQRDWAAHQWLVVRGPDGRLKYLRHDTIRYVEEV